MKLKVDYIKDKFGDAYGPMRLKLENTNLELVESTRALGCFSASVNGLLGYPSLQTIDLEKSDEAILIASYELWETLGP